MRICLVSESYPPETAAGGVGADMLTKAEGLAALGHEVHVLSSGWKQETELRTEEVGGVVVHRLLPPDRKVDITDPAASWLAYSWYVLGHLRRLEEQFRFELVNFAEFGAEGYAYQLNRTVDSWTPVAVEMYGPLMLLADRIGWPEPDSNLYTVGRHMESETIRLADRLLSFSATTARFVTETYGVDPESIDVVLCGIDLDLFSPPAERADPDRPIVLFVGNVSTQKGFGNAFEAVMRLCERHPNIVLRVVGRDHLGMRAHFERQAAEAGAADVLDWVGAVNDRETLVHHYRAASVLCAPARFEAGPVLVNIEAMACGCPVVAVDNPGTAEGVVDGETAFLVPPNEPEATARALDRVLGDAGLRARLSEQARRHVAAQFGAEHYVGRVLAAFERTVEDARARRAERERADRGTGTHSG